ncbi:3'(2'),5'-bisphosphate nucleotidase CysQ [Pseudohoeflea coraliihabitans]|uniref:3'(2'),5'-bisphosphate nucleotidase CysQ n=1 Tax=Pseudohoeflea coraliihabitans TaxID=2860393 RepID=A0ABS6WLS9_9HYPH|nr:3'(2'),5'-bisphosphate nucleotidase CysQ [Pseudohoeflea sp. DP4N28-3]MBW3096887.1 3'(2'),5'-bisphosphate nucleotidase CysQ [Pseudohoeflea sp. DP4N28-3]
MIELFCRLAVAAGESILDVRSQGIEVAHKSDCSPVTEADRRAEALITSGLAEALSDIPLVAEEAMSAGRCPAELGRRFLLVDPLDGTREFIEGRADFTVNIALIEDGVPVAGVVYAPVRRQVFAAESGRAFKQTAAADLSLSAPRPIACRPLATPPCIVASKSHRTAETNAFIARFPQAETASIGSSLKFCLLAEGSADLYPRFGRTMEWDTAAGDAVLRTAGGKTLTPDGEPLRYGKRQQAADADFANPFFIAGSAAALARCDFAA